MYRFAFFVILIFTANTCFSQFTISGRVIDAKTKAALPYATVYLIKSKVGTVTNGDGAFSINLTNKGDSIDIRFMGYRSRRVPVNKTVNLELKLQPKQFSLSEVEILGSANNEKWVKIIRNAVKYQKSQTGFSETTSKAYATNYTYKGDNTLIEAYEAFYSTRHTNLRVLENTFKNGIVKADQLNAGNHQTENMFSFGLSNINIFYTGPMDRSNDIGVGKASAYGVGKHSKNTIAINIQSPLSYTIVKEIIDNFDLNPIYLDDQFVKISFISKTVDRSSGYFIIDEKSERFSKIYIENFYDEERKIIESTKTGYNVKNVKLGIEVIFDQNSSINYPKLVNLNFGFESHHISTNVVEKRRLTSKLLLYEYDSEFSAPMPYLSYMNDYDNLALIPVFDKLWNTETKLLKTKKEEQKISKFNIVKGLNKRYEIILKDSFDIYVSKIPTDSSYTNKYVRIESFLLCNYYNINGRFYVTANGVIDYPNSRYPFNRNNDALNDYKKEHLDTTLYLVKEFEQRMNGVDELTEKKIRSEYKKMSKRYKIIRRELLKQFLDIYKEE